jgi:phosphomannomutase
MLIQSFSGIRGVYGQDLTDDIARRYAYVFSLFLKKKLDRAPLIVVGYDTRDSSDALKKAVFDSLFNIIDVGVMPIAAVELGVREFKADGGIMITASHNEPEFNGFKFLDKDGAILRPDDINEVIDEFKKTESIEEKKEKKVDDKHDELVEKYCEFLKDIVGEVDNKVKVVLDVNGGSGVVLKEMIDKLNLENIKIINAQAGEFKRKIEPNKESLEYLKDIIKDADFACGFDCDADRVEILLKDGNLVDGNYLLALIVDDVLEKNKGIVVVNDATSNLIRRVVEKHNCEVKEVEVGEINVIEEMLRLNSPIGGEGSNGGVVIPPSRCRDGILSILYLLKIINEKKKSLNQLIEELPKYFTIQKKIKFDEPIKNEIIKKKIKNYYSEEKYSIYETGDITGGLKVIINKNSFVWFRVSKTEQNLLRVIADSESEEESERLLKEASSVL